MGLRGHKCSRPARNKPEGYLEVFFTQSEVSSRGRGRRPRRMFARKEDRDAATTWETRLAQYDAVCTWGIPNHSLLQRVSAITVPVFVANGDSDPMIVPRSKPVTWCRFDDLVPGGATPGPLSLPSRRNGTSSGLRSASQFAG
jgi:hypothetical protein